MSRRNEIFTSVKTEGAILPADLLKKISEGSRNLEGLEPETYHLPDNERISTAVSRSWTRLRSAWVGFKAAKSGLGSGDYGTGITREKWLLHLFQALDYGRLQTAKGLKTKEKEYPISHIWRTVPIHLVGFGVDLDHRQKGVAGAAKISPHGLLQDYLNQEEAAIWGILSNGLKLRLLRDNVSLTRQAYVEFDLEAMFEGDLYSDFHLLWLLCHQSRFESEKPEDCWLERWSVQARAQGIRVMDSLRSGVEEALKVLGKGFISHSSNAELRQKLKKGLLKPQDYYRQLLRMVYRSLFLFVAEDRRLLLDPQANEKIKSTYYQYYSASRLRYMAGSIPGSKHGDLYRSLILLMGLLHDKGNKELGLPALNSFLWSIEAVKDLCECEISNRDLLKAIRCIAYTRKEKYLSHVDFRNLGSEELGSIYESLLELHPKIVADAGDFQLFSAQGNERKSTGSYYTPTSLIKVLLKTALDPVLEHAASQSNPEEAILDLKICDPACGSGHFLVAAAHRVARRLAIVRTGDDEPSPEAVRHALRDVVGHCLYGVDRNEMAVELCKVSLWMEGMEPGKPLSFLEHRIQCGNSLIGTTPALIAKGIPDKAFKALEGDDKKVVTALRKRNKQEKEGQTTLDFGFGYKTKQTVLMDSIASVNVLTDDSLETIQEKQKRFTAFSNSHAYKHAKAVADAWCSVFLIEKNFSTQPDCFTQDAFLKLQSDDRNIGDAPAQIAAQLADEYQLLHWHLAFPDVFKPSSELTSASKSGWLGGFDVMLGNPPWERLKIQKKEWFAQHDQEIAEAENASKRKKKIEELRERNPHLLRMFQKAKRQAEGESHFISGSGRFPLAGRGDINTFAVFSETFRDLVNSEGRAGFIVPSGLVTDDTTKFLFKDLVEKETLINIYDFENREKLFSAVDSRMKFSLVTVAGIGHKSIDPTDFVFFALRAEHLNEGDRHFALTQNELRLISPNTGSCPIFRSKRDAEITKNIYERVPVLIKEEDPNGNPWGITFQAMFHMANDSGDFRKRDYLESKGFELKGNIFQKENEVYLPLYEAKMVHQFDHRWATYINDEKTNDLTLEEKADPKAVALPRYWIEAKKVEERLAGKWEHDWLIGWRDITNVTNERTIISSVVPRIGTGHKILLMFPTGSPEQIACLLANLNSISLDYVARQKLGGTSAAYFIIKQLPLLSLDRYEEHKPWTNDKPMWQWLAEKVLELVYVTDELKPFARSLNYKGQPFKFDLEKRREIRAELDAAFFHLYEIEREDVDYILDTFPITKRKDEEKYRGEYRTKSLILKHYDAMTDLKTSAKIISFPIEPFKRVKPTEYEKYADCVPLTTLKAAAGTFSTVQEVEQLEEWAKIENSRKLRKGMFIAQVVGKSMEPTIPDGSWCLFSHPAAGSRDGRILLVQHHDIHDPETGGSYTIKRYKSTKVADDEGGWRHSEIRLEPDNKEFKPIVLKNSDEGEIQVIADFIKVLSE